MESKIMLWLSNPIVLSILFFIIGNCLRKMPPIWKIIAYLIIQAIEHWIHPLPLRQAVKRTVNKIITQRQKELLDQTLGNMGYLQKSKKGAK